MVYTDKFSLRRMSKDQSRDTGMAMVLLALLIYLKTRRNSFLYAAMVLQVVDMIVPRVYAPVAVVWLGLAEVLGTVMSRVLLAILFFGLVTPIGVLRRLFGKDSLRLTAFKSSRESAMILRNHLFVGQDLEKPY